MSSQSLPAKRRTEFNLTYASTLDHLLAAGCACAGIWALIMVTFGA